jgi:stage II sporulation protein D
VGLSQYGADAMALAGNDYKKILAHYYPGTTVETYQVNK